MSPLLIKSITLVASLPSPPLPFPAAEPEKGNDVSLLPNGPGEEAVTVRLRELPRVPNRFLQVVLVSPQIPGNTGCIARTCAASAVGLHLVGEGEKRLLAFTKRGTQEFSYRKGDWLVFGSETAGLPPEALLDCKSEAYGGGTLRIPMVETYVRCLNLSVSVGIALYEACRQLNYEQLQFQSEKCIDNEPSLIFSEDIFA
ncbi:hypothetical protein CDL15_Pgr016083 [Punica granatum]|uniref:tRNA/rRNA methyltransferase SpoU type domain-containing protein n=1 Tax=Punica granatum TaxID=22663 RepID=A0A218X0V7_PUNGR|nr:hypothetical protein CDL15_Pgr016083 [Punica granatum]